MKKRESEPKVRKHDMNLQIPFFRLDLEAGRPKLKSCKGDLNLYVYSELFATNIRVDINEYPCLLQQAFPWGN